MPTDPNTTVNQPSSDPEMPVPTPPQERNTTAEDARSSEIVNEQIEDRFEATDN